MMKKKLKLIILFYFVYFSCIYTQPSLDIFKNIVPNWVHATFDTTALNIVGYNDNTKLRHLQSEINGDYLYRLFRYDLQNSWENDGGYIEKINLKDGTELWRAFYDIRSIDINEIPNSFNIKNDTVEIIGARLLNREQGNGSTPYKTLVRRKYDPEGKLIEYFYADPEDSTNLKFVYNYFNKMYFRDDTTILLIDRYKIDTTNYLLFSNIDYKGKIIYFDTIPFIDTLYDNYSEDLYRINENTYFTAFHSQSLDYYQDSQNIKFFIKYFDNQLKVIKSIDLSSDFKDAGITHKLSIVYADDKYFVLSYFNEIFSNEFRRSETYYFYDHSGNRLDSIDKYESKIIYSKIKRISQDEFLIVGAYGGGQLNKDLSLNLYKKKIGGSLELLKKIEMRKKEGLLLVNDIHLSDEKAIILVGDYAEIKWSTYILYDLFPLITSFRYEDIFTSVLEHDSAVILFISPNPASDYFTFTCHEAGTKSVELLDQLGRVVLRQKIEECEDNQVNINAIQSGLYVVRLLNERGEVIGTGKIVVVK